MLYLVTYALQSPASNNILLPQSLWPLYYCFERVFLSLRNRNFDFKFSKNLLPTQNFGKPPDRFSENPEKSPIWLAP